MDGSYIYDSGLLAKSLMLTHRLPREERRQLKSPLIYSASQLWRKVRGKGWVGEAEFQ